MLTGKKYTILYVEDDETLGFVTRDNLEQKGFQVIHYSSGQEVLDSLPSIRFELAILDIMLPDVDGFSLAKEIRAMDAEVPILFLTAKSLKEDRLKGFELGADDYITKPYSIEELIFRINVFIKRRLTVYSENTQKYIFGHFTFDFQNQTLITPDENKTITQREAAVLQMLLKNKNQIVKRSDMLQQIWGEDDYFMGRSLDVFISRWRKYLSSDPSIQIENIHGVGFKINV